ncbi:MAG: leucyl aminopeptidase family protein [Tatlockia sp.]
MQTDSFYTSTSEQAHPLHLVSQTHWEQGIENLDSQKKNCLQSQQFSGKQGEMCLTYNQDGQLDAVYLGTGEGNQVKALSYAATRLPAGCYRAKTPLSHTAEVYWSLAQYRFMRYKKEPLACRTLVVNETNLPAILAESSALCLVRDLINTPTSDLGPKELSAVLEALAKKYQAHFSEVVGDALTKANLNAIYTVGRASSHSPRLLMLEWGEPTHPAVTLVGKGVCFDSGGLNIKSASAMRLMKKDMGGAAHAIGLAQWIMAQQVPVHLRVFIPAVENAVGPEAFRPGDVITMHNGLTVEVDNTDAEGRLVLADALSKSNEKKSDLLIDFATLTGSARVAVGTDIAAMFSNDDALAEAITRSSKAVDDPVWRLPLFGGYESMLDSPVANLVNACDSPYGGAITAALFLQHFVAESTPWLHFDIMAWNTSAKPGKPQGGEAMALRALMHYLSTTYASGH